jgi:hypothetical protein
MTPKTKELLDAMRENFAIYVDSGSRFDEYLMAAQAFDHHVSAIERERDALAAMRAEDAK